MMFMFVSVSPRPCQSVARRSSDLGDDCAVGSRRCGRDVQGAAKVYTTDSLRVDPSSPRRPLPARLDRRHRPPDRRVRLPPTRVSRRVLLRLPRMPAPKTRNPGGLASLPPARRSSARRFLPTRCRHASIRSPMTGPPATTRTRATRCRDQRQSVGGGWAAPERARTHQEIFPPLKGARRECPRAGSARQHLPFQSSSSKTRLEAGGW